VALLPVANANKMSNSILLVLQLKIENCQVTCLSRDRHRQDAAHVPFAKAAGKRVTGSILKKSGGAM
jgi:hypothetical protein